MEEKGVESVGEMENQVHEVGQKKSAPIGIITRIMKNKWIIVISIICIVLVSAILVIKLKTPLDHKGAIKVSTPIPMGDQHKALPRSMDVQAAAKLISDMETAYNGTDVESLYNILGKYGKQFITLQDFGVVAEQMRKLGKMENGKFRSYKYNQNKDGADWFEMTYTAKFNTKSGTALVTIRVAGDTWEVVGYKFDLD